MFFTKALLTRCRYDLKRFHWTGADMILLRIDKRSHDVGMQQNLLTAPSSEDWVWTQAKTWENLKGTKV